MTNNSKVLRHLRTQGSISALEAMIVHRIQRLAHTIHELRADGWCIDTLSVKDSAGHPYTRYELR